MNRNYKWWFNTALLGALHPCLASKRVWYNTKRVNDDILSTFKFYNYPYHCIFLAGMAMSGSTWMKNLLARIPGYYTRSTPMPRDIAVNQNICDSAFKHVPKHGYTLFKTHLNPTQTNLECIFRNGVKKVLITHRDLRDVIIGRYHRLMDFPSVKERGDPFFADYRAMGKEKAMDHNIEVVASFHKDWILGWLEIVRNSPEQYHIVKFEDLKKDTEGEFKKVLYFYGINLSDDRIKKIIALAQGKGNVRRNITVSRLLPWGLSSNFRSGKTGNWRQELSTSQVEKCKKLLGPALIELGYEKDLNW